MPSTFLVPVATIDAIKPHTNADTLELAHVLGWQIVVRKGEHHVGEKVVYFPPDTVLPVEVSDRFGVTKYLSNGRIRCAKLRGEPSFGLVVTPDDLSWEVGEHVAEHYGATKYMPPLRPSAGDAETQHPLFEAYTNIENLRNFPDILQEGEEVIVTEKIHGTNCRIGIIEGEVMAGSHAVRRKKPADDALASNTYWFPWSLPEVSSMLESLSVEHKQVILYGEVFGSPVQSLDYGVKGALAFRAFDLLIDGSYVDPARFFGLCEDYGVEVVPLLADSTTQFSVETIKALSTGSTTINGATHIREGVVVKPLHERRDEKIGRVILKYLNDDYLLSKESDYTDA